MKEVLFDFNLGYISTAVMAFIFVSLGVMLMFKSGEHFSSNGAVFASQLLGLYTKTIGVFSYMFVAIGIFFTMFSTVLAAMDAYTRVFRHGASIIKPELSEKQLNNLYVVVLLTLNIGSFFITLFLSKGLTALVDFSTTMSFLITPLLAYLNYKVILMPNVPKSKQPGQFLKILSVSGIIFWIIFAFIYVITII